jgi:hypothetical protein
VRAACAGGARWRTGRAACPGAGAPRRFDSTGESQTFTGDPSPSRARRPAGVATALGGGTLAESDHGFLGRRVSRRCPGRALPSLYPSQTQSSAVTRIRVTVVRAGKPGPDSPAGLHPLGQGRAHRDPLGRKRGPTRTAGTVCRAGGVTARPGDGPATGPSAGRGSASAIAWAGWRRARPFASASWRCCDSYVYLCEECGL